jgi:hypothetical protein
MATAKRTKNKGTMIYKIQDGKLKVEQQDLHIKHTGLK